MEFEVKRNKKEFPHKMVEMLKLNPSSKEIKKSVLSKRHGKDLFDDNNLANILQKASTH